MNLILQFITTFISGVVSAEKSAKEFLKKQTAESAAIQKFIANNQIAQQNAETQILGTYEEQLASKKLVSEIEAGGFALFLIIIAIVIVVILSK